MDVARRRYADETGRKTFNSCNNAMLIAILTSILLNYDVRSEESAGK